MEIFVVSETYLNFNIPEDKFFLLTIGGRFVEIMCEVKPEHKENVRVDNRVKLLYLKLMKYLYGCMEYELLCYDIY